MTAPRLTIAERTALDELRAWLHERFGARLDRVTLFGSRARGEGDEDSDVDVLVTVADLAPTEAREIGHLAGDLLTRHDVLISPLAVSTARWRELIDRERLITREIARDGVAL